MARRKSSKRRTRRTTRPSSTGSGGSFEKAVFAADSSLKPYGHNNFMFDAAHIAGLIADGQHTNPVPLADVVTFTTNKKLK